MSRGGAPPPQRRRTPLVDATPPPPLVIRVTGSSDSLAAGSCFIRIRSRVVGGGTETYCLERFSGMPAPRAIAHDSGVITFVVQNGTLRARMRIVQRFRASALRYVVRLRPPPQP